MPDTPAKLTFPVTRRLPRLKIGLLLTGLRQPCWAAQMIALLASQSFIELVMIHPRARIQAGSPENVSNLAWKVFGIFDQTLHARKIPPSHEVEIQPRDYSCRDLPVPMTVSGGRLGFDNSAGLREIKNLDFLLLFERVRLDSQVAQAAKFGMAAFPSRFLEWRIPERVVDFFYQLARFGENSFKRDPYAATFPPGQEANFDRFTITLGMLLMARILVKKVSIRLFDFFFKERWEVAYRFSDRPVLQEPGLEMPGRLRPPAGMIFGDPFPLRDGERTFLFFEEMKADDRHYTHSGHISVQELDRERGLIGRPRRALERNYHLSYPFIFSWQGNYYMLPETQQNRAIELYRCVSFPDQWEFCKTLVENIPAVDTTLFEKNGMWWMFAAVHHDPPAAACGAGLPQLYALNLYFSESPLDGWRSHPRNPVKFNRTSARCAGRILEHGGRLYRPAQDCTPGYGRAVVFNRIEILSMSEYLEVEEASIQPPDLPGILGVHTFNTCGELQVVDYLTYRNRFLP